MPREYNRHWLERYLEALEIAYKDGEISKYVYDQLRRGVKRDYEAENA